MPAAYDKVKLLPLLAELDYYQKVGFNLIPLKARDKRPAIESWSAYQNRQSTIGEREAWFGSGHANVGVVTGAVSKLVVLDLDSEEVFNHVLENDPDLCKTTMVETGRGYHLYLRPLNDADPGQTFPMNVDGMDGKHHMKANGGYVVAPPSIHPSGSVYSWLGSDGGPDPDPIKVIDLTELVARLGDLGFKRSAPEGAETPDGFWDEFISTTHGEGSRADSLIKLMGILRASIASPAIAYELARCWNLEHLRPPLSDVEVQRTVKSYYRYAA